MVTRMTNSILLAEFGGKGERYLIIVDGRRRPGDSIPRDLQEISTGYAGRAIFHIIFLGAILSIA